MTRSMWLNDLSELVPELECRGVTRIGLQFPDGLKRKAVALATMLTEAGFSVVISGDPCYGACDLATDLAAITDQLVHFGHTPLDDDPGVIYIPYRIDFNPAVIDRVVPSLAPGTIGLVTTAQHAHLIPALCERLERRGARCIVGQGGKRTPFPGQILGCSVDAARIPGVSTILYIGTGIFHPLGVRIATGARVIAVDPFTGDITEVEVAGFIRKRMLLVERCRDAKTAGIIISPKGGQARLALAERLSAIRPGAFLVLAREVTPDVLLNLGCDMYVNTACPRLAYDDQVRFPRPLLAPQEYEILCGTRTWDDYQIDEMTCT